MTSRPASQADTCAVPGPAARDVWDVVVVGAGPSGSAAARAASQRGAATLLLDSAEFPRYKTCGGGLIGVSSALIEHAGDLPVRDRITRVSFTFHGGGRQRLRTARHSLITMVSREDLDLHLVNRAVESGTVFRPRTKVVRIEEDPAGLVRVHTPSECLLARAVVGADGSSGRVARHVGVRYAVTDVGLEYELAAGAQAERWRGRVHLDWGRIPGSYGWVFPKGDTLTVGVIAERGRPAETRAYLTQLVDRLGLSDLAVIRDSGHLTRCRESGSPLRRGRVLVAGDAAGMLEPWTREGISFALRSGHLAGTRAAQMCTAVTPDDVGSVGEGYTADIERVLGWEMHAGALARAAFCNHPGFFHFLVGWTAPGWNYFCRITSGDTNLGRALRHRTVRVALVLLRLSGRRRGRA